MRSTIESVTKECALIHVSLLWRNPLDSLWYQQNFARCGSPLQLSVGFRRLR